MPEQPDPKISVRTLTELRQDTTKKSQEALLRRIQYFDQRRQFPLQDKIEDFFAGLVTQVVNVRNAIERALPERVTKAALDLYEKLLLAF
ncbi:MAG: hypothetical protein Kow0069_03180 [Promethearchaeota archaeon]